MGAHQVMQNVPSLSHATRADAVTGAGFVLALLSGAAAILAGFGSRAGWWYFMTGFSSLRDAAIIGFLAAVASLVGGIMVRQEHHSSLVALAAAGIVIGLVTAGIPTAWLHTALKMPRIHDISTDTVTPPQFVKIMPLRKHAENSAAYDPADAVEQRAAYPDIKPVVLPLPTTAAFEDAFRTAKDLGWQIVAADVPAGRIEAVATTFWFGFKDDVVVRVKRVSGGSRVDVRSVSRVGLSDVGTNASRIRKFLHKMADTASIDPSYTGYSLGYSLGY